MIRRDLFWWGAACALSMLCASAHGQSCDTSGWQRAKLAETQVHPAMVKVTVADGRGGQSHGSGVIIDKHEDRAYVLTCWHIFRDGARAVYVCIPQLGCAPGQVEAVSQLWDAAIVSIPSNPRLQFVRTAETSPRVGDVVFVGGYGSGQWRWQAGRVRQYLSPGGGAAFDMIEVSAASREGDSGGPMLDEPGRVCGVLCGNGGRSAAGTGIARLRAIFAAVVPAWRPPAPPNVTEGGPLEPIDLPANDPPAPPGGTAEPSMPPTANAPAPAAEAKPANEPETAPPDSSAFVQDRVAPQGSGTGMTPGASGAGGGLSDLVAGFAGRRIAGWLTPILISGLAVLGIAPPAGVVYFVTLAGLKLGRRWLHARRAKRKGKNAQPTTQPGQTGGSAPAGREFPSIVRDATEGHQLLQLRQLEGRDPLCDSLIGVLALDSLEKAIASGSDPAEKAWATRFRDKLLVEFNRVVPPTVVTEK